MRQHQGEIVQLITVNELARMLKLSRSKVYDLKEKIGYLKIGGSVRFRLEDVICYLDGCKMERDEKPHRPVNLPQLKHLKLS